MAPRFLFKDIWGKKKKKAHTWPWLCYLGFQLRLFLTSESSMHRSLCFWTSMSEPVGIGGRRCREKEEKKGHGRIFISWKCDEQARGVFFFFLMNLCHLVCVSSLQPLTSNNTLDGITWFLWTHKMKSTCPGSSWGKWNHTDGSVLRSLKETCYTYPWYAVAFFPFLSFSNVVLIYVQLKALLGCSC